MIKKKMNKKGIAISFLIGLIILVIGFTILLFFYYQIGWTGRVDKEICHQSVIYRATLPQFAGAREYVPLKCKTEKVCITSGLIGGECKEFENAEGVGKFKVSSLGEIEQFMAREMIECWSMMGQGKVQIFGNWFVEKYGFGTIGSSCVLCTRIAFDKEKLEKAGINLDELDVMKYMQTHEVPNNNISYYSYLAGQGGEFSVDGGIEIGNLSELNNVEKQEIKDYLVENKLGGSEIIDAPLELEIFEDYEESIYDEKIVMFMQTTAPGNQEAFTNLLKTSGALLGFSFGYKPGAFFGARKIPSGIKLSGNRWRSIATGRFVKTPKLGAAITPFIKIIALAAIIAGVAQYANIERNQNIAAGYCGDVSLGEDAREGCSVVRITQYNATEIINYCTTIESIS